MRACQLSRQMRKQTLSKNCTVQKSALESWRVYPLVRLDNQATNRRISVKYRSFGTIQVCKSKRKLQGIQCSKRDRGTMLRSRDAKPARYVTALCISTRESNAPDQGFPPFQAIYDLGNRLRRFGGAHCIFTKKIGRPGIMEMEMASDFRVTAQV